MYFSYQFQKLSSVSKYKALKGQEVGDGLDGLV